MGGITRESHKLGRALGFRGGTYSHIEEGKYKNEFLKAYKIGELIKEETLNSIDFPIPSSILSSDFYEILSEYFDYQYDRKQIFDSWNRELSKFLGNNLEFNRNVPSLYNAINIKLLESIEKQSLEEYLDVLRLKMKYIKTVGEYKCGNIPKDEYKELLKELKSYCYS